LVEGRWTVEQWSEKTGGGGDIEVGGAEEKRRGERQGEGGGWSWWDRRGSVYVVDAGGF
jgi:hypothetical protein